MGNWYHWQGTDLLLRVRVQPGARRDEIVEIHDNALKIKITAPPVEGKANQHLRAYLAKICKVKKTKVTIEAGLTARNKTLRLQLEEARLPGCFHRELAK
ncbi:MAG: DUF167 family protein [Thioalkalispiraceae bacterium]